VPYKNPADQAACAKRWRERNRERDNENHRAWRAANVEIARLNERDAKRKRRAEKRA
jgi:hypothetical protein